MQERFLWQFPDLEGIQGVLDGVRRSPVGPPGPLELAALTLARTLARKRARVHSLRSRVTAPDLLIFPPARAQSPHAHQQLGAAGRSRATDVRTCTALHP